VVRGNSYQSTTFTFAFSGPQDPHGREADSASRATVHQTDLSLLIIRPLVSQFNSVVATRAEIKGSRPRERSMLIASPAPAPPVAFQDQVWNSVFQNMNPQE